MADYDAIIIGAGFSGIRALWQLGQLGLTVKCFEAGSDVAGTWYWNRYPGARTDSEAWVYSMNFAPEVSEDWSYTERYPSQKEVQQYLGRVVGQYCYSTNHHGFPEREAFESSAYFFQPKTTSTCASTSNSIHALRPRVSMIVAARGSLPPQVVNRQLAATSWLLLDHYRSRKTCPSLASNHILENVIERQHGPSTPSASKESG